MPTPGTGLRGVLPLEDRCSRVGTALALDAKRDGHGEGKMRQDPDMVDRVDMCRLGGQMLDAWYHVTGLQGDLRGSISFGF